MSLHITITQTLMLYTNAAIGREKKIDLAVKYKGEILLEVCNLPAESFFKYPVNHVHVSLNIYNEILISGFYP